jgi:ribosomal protein L40E
VKKSDLANRLEVYCPIRQSGVAAARNKSQKTKEINVASFCSKCGAELSPDAQSCIACGTPVVAVAVPVAQPVVVAPAKQGSSALKIILIIIAVFVGLGLIGAGAFGYFVWRVAHAVHMASSSGQLTIPTPGGTITANSSQTFTSADLGTDIYPGATQGKGGLRMSLPTGSMVTAIYVTSDSKDQVVAFYKSKLGDGATVMDSADGDIVTLNRGQQESVMVTVTANSSQYSGKTQIAIVHTTSTKSN